MPNPFKIKKISKPVRVAVANPMSDFFNHHAPSLAFGLPIPPDSKHTFYLHEMKASRLFIQDMGMSSPMQLEQECRIFFRSFGQLSQAFKSRFGIDHLHIYFQEYDLRRMHDVATLPGWCFGISAYWNQLRLAGREAFPLAIYTDVETKTMSGGPIRLTQIMEANAIAVEQGRMKIDNSKCHPNIRIALEYINGKKSGTNFPHYLVLGVADPEQGNRLANCTAKVLSNAEKKHRSPHASKPLYLIQKTSPGGGHLMALDMAAGRFFDPNSGEYAHESDPKRLAKFVFEIYLPVRYGSQHPRKKVISQLFVYRC